MQELLEKQVADHKSYLDMELLRFTTAGSVDDGKSTLIGRLLYDSKAIFQDQLDAVKQASLNKGTEKVDLALFTDGLRSEREQGITIDVAYRYFATPKRKFIIADTPGHVQYTRNMVTGASTGNAALILIDARKGVIEQTLRHSYIASLLQIPHVVICINKMDLVDYKEEVYEQIKEQYEGFIAKLDIPDVHFVPLSALEGDNVVTRSKKMPWYQGSTLLHLLENIHIGSDYNHTDGRFPVQYVLRPQTTEFHDYRGYAGRVAGGVFKKGDKVKVLPSGFTSVVKEVSLHGKRLDRAFPPMAVDIQLEDEIDISRGDMIVHEDNTPETVQDIEATVVWMSETPMQLRKKYTMLHTSNDGMCMIKEINHQINIHTLEEEEGKGSLAMNEIASVSIRSSKPMFVDSYTRNRITGSFVLVEEGTNNTVGVGMIK